MDLREPIEIVVEHGAALVVALGRGEVRASRRFLHHDAGLRLAESVHVRHRDAVRLERAQHLHLAAQRLDAVVLHAAVAAVVHREAFAAALELAEPRGPPALLALGRAQPPARDLLDLAERGAPLRVGEQRVARQRRGPAVN